MRFKKISLVILLIVVSISFSIFASCGTSVENQHIHTYSTWDVKIKSSCYAEGMKSRTCSGCGFTEYSAIAKTKHEFDGGTIISYATPVKRGTIRYTCTTPKCNYNYLKNYELELDNAYDILLAGLYENATSNENGYVAYDYYLDWQVQYALTYDEQKRELVVCTRVRVENEGVVFFNITLEKNTKLFAYLGLFEDIENSTNSSQTFGYINGFTFTSAETLGYIQHYGSTASLASRMEIFGWCANKCIAFINAFLNEYEIDTTIYALGFTAY